MSDPRPRQGEGYGSGVSLPTVTPVLVADLLAEGERMPVYVHLIDHPDARVLCPGLRLVPAPGHTRGMQVVVVETGGRPVVVGGDVAVWFGEPDEPYRRPAAGTRARPRAGLARARARA